ncbi:MAG: helix-turn-helix transcriptional regulator, partial [Gemmatimonadales bacterium]
MNREIILARTATLELSRHDHPADQKHVDPAEEVGRHWSLSLVEANAFEVRVGRNRWRLTEGSAFLSRPGLVYRCAHDHHEPLDVCLSLAIHPSLIEALRSADLFPDHAPSGTPASNRLRYLHHRLQRWQESGGELLAGETLAGELVATAAQPSQRPMPLFRPAQLRRYAGSVDAARHRLETEHARRHTLTALAAEAGMSLYHFARVFRQLAGVPPHRYLLKVRLARAADLLRSGVAVSRTCYDVGFDSLSHFAEAFRKEYGVVPSRYAGGTEKGERGREKGEGRKGRAGEVRRGYGEQDRGGAPANCC